MLKVFQCILAILLLGISVAWVGGAQLLHVFFNLDFIYLSALLILSFVLIWVSCLKWKLFVEEGGGTASIFLLMKIYTTSYFFNLFMPSYLGGDAARSFQLGKFIGSQHQAFAATFLERVTGLIALVLLGLFFALSGASATFGLRTAIVLISIPVLLATLPLFSEACAKVFFPILEKLILALLPVRFEPKVSSILSKVDESMAYARGNWKLVFKALGLSLLFHILAVINTYVAAKSVGWSEPSLGGIFVVIPLIMIVGMLPLTPNGIGVQEGAFLFFLERIGASSEHALAVGLILRAKVILLAILGGLIFVLMKRGEVKTGAFEVDNLQVGS